MRIYSSNITSEIQGLLTQLTLSPDQTGVDAYRAAMTALGRSFVRVHAAKLSTIHRLLLICTNEDADFLAQGVLDELATFPTPMVSLACFWNDRETIRGTKSNLRVDLAPITRRYVETGDVDAFLVVKSIISSACVVQTNITELVDERNPAQIFVFAPVILQGGEDKLRQEFDPEIARRFEFFWFAQDDEKDGENVRPGIGGQVYERLGLGTRAEKNRYTPMLVRERRLAIS